MKRFKLPSLFHQHHWGCHAGARMADWKWNASMVGSVASSRWGSAIGPHRFPGLRLLNEPSLLIVSKSSRNLLPALKNEYFSRNKVAIATNCTSVVNYFFALTVLRLGEAQISPPVSDQG